MLLEPAVVETCSAIF